MADFNTAECEQVRKAIDVSLNENELSDAVINLDIYKGEAVSVIDGLLTGLTPEQKTTYAADINRAYRMMTAALIAPKVSQLTSETLEGDKWTFQAKDYDKIGEGLKAAAFNIIDRIYQAIPTTAPETDSSFAASLFQTIEACPK